MKERKIHYRNVELYNNRGMYLPLCGNAGRLDNNRGSIHTTFGEKLVTCKQCRAILRKETK